MRYPVQVYSNECKQSARQTRAFVHKTHESWAQIWHHNISLTEICRYCVAAEWLCKSPNFMVVHVQMSYSLLAMQACQVVYIGCYLGILSEHKKWICAVLKVSKCKWTRSCQQSVVDPFLTSQAALPVALERVSVNRMLVFLGVWLCYHSFDRPAPYDAHTVLYITRTVHCHIEQRDYPAFPQLSFHDSGMCRLGRSLRR